MKQYVLTERAHLMCPNMHFGIRAKIAARYDEGKFHDALRALAVAHPFLKSNIAQEAESGKLYYCRHEELKIPVFKKDNAFLWQDDYRDITRNGWNAFQESLLKLIVYPASEAFEVILIAHHLLGDGRSILHLVCEFANCYLSGKTPALAEENLISSIDELPKGSQLSSVNQLIIGYANRKRKQERHTVSYEDYTKFETEFIANNPVSYPEEAWEPTKTEEVLRKCHEQVVSLNDYLIAEMMLKEKTNRVVAAVDIRRYLSRYQAGALGNYASATAIEVSSKSKDIWEIARFVSERIKKNISNPEKLMMILACYLNMEPELIDAAAISAMGGFHSKAGDLLGQSFLGIKNAMATASQILEMWIIRILWKRCSFLPHPLRM